MGNPGGERIAPLDAAELPAPLRPLLDHARSSMGFTPNDLLVMARAPDLLQGIAAMVQAIWQPGAVDMQLTHLVGLVASAAGGCPY